MQVWSPLLLDLLIVALALAGVLLLGLHLLTHVWTAGGGVPYAPLAMLFSSATAAALRNRVPWHRRAYWQREDRRVLLVSAVTLMVGSVLVALFSIGVMADAHRRGLINDLQVHRNAIIGGMDGAVRVRSGEVAALSSSPQLRALLADATHVPQPNISDFVAALHVLQPADWRVTDVSGQVVYGESAPLPPLVALPAVGTSRLGITLGRPPRSANLELRVRAAVQQNARLLGHLTVDLPLPAVTGLLRGLQREHPGSYIRLCSKAPDGAAQCIEDRANRPMIQLPAPGPAASAPEQLSLLGRHASAVLAQGSEVRAVSYGQLPTSRLGPVVSTPASALFSPVLRTALLLIPGLVLLGLLALAWQLRPLVRDLHRQRNMFKTVFDHSGMGIELVDAKGRILDCNPALAHMLGYSREEVLALPDVYALIPETERDKARANISQMAQHEVGAYCTDRPYLHRNGNSRTLRWHVSPVHDEAGAIQFIASFCVDVTEANARAQALAFHTAFLNAALDELHDAIYAVNERGLVIYANQAAHRVGVPSQMSLSREELFRLSPVYTLLHEPADMNTLPLACALRGEQVREQDYAIRNPAGEWRQHQISAYPLRNRNGDLLGAVGVAHDVTAQRVAETRLRWLVEHDELTRLPNRFQAQQVVTRLLDENGRGGNDTTLGLMLIDIDRFKHINDSYGHAFGDQLLRAVAERLKRDFEPEATVFRLGSDEFAIVTTCPRQGIEGLLAHEAQRAFAQPFIVAGQTLFISATTGLACAPEDGQNADTLFARVDVALYRAKAMQPGSALRWRADMGWQGRRLVELETDLRSALAQEQFIVYYQPKVCLRTGVLLGAEALLRWRHPQRGLVSPTDFIPLLEQTGLIVSVGAWVLRTVCQQVRQWRDGGLTAVPVAVNCSVRQLQGDLLLRQVREALAASGIPADLLELEVTESMMLDDPQHVSGLIAQLRASGVKTSIDDFGTGYSSLATLKRLPVAALKLDRAFVKDLPDDPDDAAITRAVLSMAQALHLDVIAEGVETLEQAAFLGALGCASYQGYLFSPPVPAEQFARFL